MSDTVIRVENISKLYRLGEVGTGSLAHDVNRWWHRVRGKEDPYLKIGEVNDRTKPAKQASSKKSLTTEDTESTERGAGGNQRADSGEFLEGHSQAGMQMDSEKLAFIRSANDSRVSGEQTGLVEKSAEIVEICGKNSTASAPQAPSDWVYALKDVSFEVKRGEVLGIIGRNGAGKSTLLKILSRVTTQSSGQIKVKGRIASLLEVGTGFHPELTGRENIFLNGAILGMRKAEIARKFDEIVDFSGCARYIDTPVKRYSSGMYVRLAFAVAAHLEPEILIVDEVLAVGDAEFQKKCLGKMKDVAGHGRTILFVSHNMSAVKNLCHRSVLLENGTVKMVDNTSVVLDRYAEKSVQELSFNWRRPVSDKKLPSFYIETINISLQGKQPNLNLICTVELKSKNASQPVFIAVDICDSSLIPIMQALPSAKPFIPTRDKIKAILTITLPQLIPGIYILDFWIGSHFSQTIDYVRNAVRFEITESPTPGRTAAHPTDHGFIVPASTCETY
jgi:lipopolysaccharide transport system ATP-binding protein